LQHEHGRVERIVSRRVAVEQVGEPACDGEAADETSP